MASSQGLCKYERRTGGLLPDKSSIIINLKGHDTKLTLDVPGFGVTCTTQPDTGPSASGSAPGNDNLTPLSRVFQAHVAFKLALQPGVKPSDKFYAQCVAEVNAVSLFFPDIESEDILICFTAWLAFACVMDDILESLPPPVQEASLNDSIAVVQRRFTCAAKRRWLSGTSKWLRRVSKKIACQASGSAPKDTRVKKMAKTLHEHCARHLSKASFDAFFKAVVLVLRAHLDEIRFLQRQLSNDLPTYMSIRSRTIALNPFFEVLKCEYLTPEIRSNGAWEKLQLEVSRAAGLQNDLIGLERDLQDGEPLNAVIVLLSAFGNGKDGEHNSEHLSKYIDVVSSEHNQNVARALDRAAELQQAYKGAAPETVNAITEVARHILLLCETHLKWCASAKRYQTQPSQPGSESGESTRGQQSFDSRPSSQTMTSPGSQMVHSNGIYHGLPVFPDTPDTQGLTALVTGATGLSGYHMVKVLAASRRWKKVYCLSSRPPPANFLADLGEGAERIEHVVIDFLADPSEIGQCLMDNVPKVDHIFYFSYKQPAPKGNVLDLWANADELASVNVSLFANFITALKQHTNLRPKRFMLQTGSKHYAFYLGPASLPAFESDPRVTLDRNFYYEQEDTLFDYCRSIGASWNVARPSYIVGAVRDGTLNHLIGFGIYAAVQAYLKQPIVFPGDYSAWDREQVQSTGLLNAYFEEWMVLNEDAADHAFNIHDGLSFTWGRLWPLLAQWYGVDWTPPEVDETKYRVMKLPYPQTPRGYGPQLTLRSTFSLLEWSLQPHVEKAWRELSLQHDLVLDPFDDQYRARIFSFSDSAVIGDAPMTTSVRKARQFGFFGTVDSYHSIFQSLHDLARLKLVVAPAVTEFSPQW